MSVLPAPAALAALKSADARWPSRSRASDGTLPSAAHAAASPHSDHNLGNAVDITAMDRAHGDAIAEAALRDPRTTYVIWFARIWNVSRGDRDWRPYDGANAHKHHVHISIAATAREDASPWPWDPSREPVALGIAARLSAVPTKVKVACGVVLAAAVAWFGARS